MRSRLMARAGDGAAQTGEFIFATHCLLSNFNIPAGVMVAHSCAAAAVCTALLISNRMKYRSYILDTTKPRA
jgi:hypothetical protein